MAMLALKASEGTNIPGKIGAAIIACLLFVSAPGIAAIATPFSIDLSINNRAVAPKIEVIRVTEGQDIEINWTTDERVLLHLHGYDITVTVKPGEIVTMKFNAATSGRFPITAHNFAHRTLIYLEVYPE